MAGHKQHLESKGLADRAQHYGAVDQRLVNQQSDYQRLTSQPVADSYQVPTAVPQEVVGFDPQQKSTVITTDPDYPGNRPEDVAAVLDIRFPPFLQQLVKQYGLEVFLGTSKGW